MAGGRRLQIVSAMFPEYVTSTIAAGCYLFLIFDENLSRNLRRIYVGIGRNLCGWEIRR